jgi:nitrogen-specific signal transduction histidine kinase
VLLQGGAIDVVSGQGRTRFVVLLPAAALD